MFDPADTDDAPIEMVLALGGDGTLLRAAEHARPLAAPVLGINLGRVGFLAEADAADMDWALSAVIDRRYRLSPRMTVETVVELEGMIIANGWALNEISVEKGHRERILDVVVEVDGHGVSAYGCDGVLCATPTGSTAYTFSGGGPVMWPGRGRAADHPVERARAVRPRAGDRAGLDGHRAPRSRRPVRGARLRRAAKPGDPARVADPHLKGQQPVMLVRLSDQTFTDRLVRKFKLPVHGWRDQRY